VGLITWEVPSHHGSYLSAQVRGGWPGHAVEEKVGRHRFWPNTCFSISFPFSFLFSFMFSFSFLDFNLNSNLVVNFTLRLNAQIKIPARKSISIILYIFFLFIKGFTNL
jgi:hypothetical protein